MSVINQILRGAAITFVSRYVGVLIGLIINGVLARLVTPTEFGIVAVVSVFTTFFASISDLGLGSAVIQSNGFDNKDFSNLFQISLLLSIVLAIFFGLFSYAIEWFYGNKVYLKIGWLLSISIFFGAASVVPRALVIRTNRFGFIAIIDVSVNVFCGIIAIYLAKNGFSFYSIVWRLVLVNFGLFCVYYFNNSLTIFTKPSLIAYKKVSRYSRFQFYFNIINYFSRNLDNILVGKVLGASELGIYNQSYQLMMYPLNNITSVFSQVLHPILSKFQSDIEKIITEYLKIIEILARVGLFVSIVTYFCSTEIVLLLLGSKWMSVVPILKVLSISIWVQMILSSIGSIFLAIGKSDILFLSGLLSAVIMVLAILAGLFIFKSIIVMSSLLVLAFYFNFFQAYFFLLNVVCKKSIKIILLILYNQLPMVVCLIATQLAFSKIVSLNSFVLLLVYKFILAVLVFVIFNFSFLKQKLFSRLF